MHHTRRVLVIKNEKTPQSKTATSTRKKTRAKTTTTTGCPYPYPGEEPGRVNLIHRHLDDGSYLDSVTEGCSMTTLPLLLLHHCSSIDQRWDPSLFFLPYSSLLWWPS